MVEFPSWWTPEEGAPPVFYHTEAQVPKGWTHVPGSYNFQTGQWIDADPLDHDGSGKKGGSVSDEMKDLRAAYLDKFGKKAFNGWKADKLREMLA